MVASAFGKDQSGGSATCLTVEDLKYLYMDKHYSAEALNDQSMAFFSLGGSTASTIVKKADLYFKILTIINPKISKRRKVSQLIWQSFLKSLSPEITYFQSLKGSEVLELMRYTLQFIPSTQVEVLK
ncbi:hypothetical protein NC653_040503 [Populus alba x Populus x berolinensis]|uniref:Uncharacterized protein n=1 Tax=Populus alba x Populus x berolinensis TaxID=444605 RepID=A0AAD6PPR3_9ROSI|nr:hypothetical protein NC653_040503 [Populus alba x Populus x berolinensis]